MYIPPAFVMNNAEDQFSFIEENSFGIFFSHINNVPFATHLPFILDRENNCMYTHFALANPQAQISPEDEVLIVFSGPHCYISPASYGTNRAVPTWNYTAVHVYGTVQEIEDRERKLAILAKSIEVYEKYNSNPWTLSQADASYVEQLLKGIVVVQIDITKMEGKAKLSQNQLHTIQQNIIQALVSSENESAKQVAERMKANGHTQF